MNGDNYILYTFNKILAYIFIAFLIVFLWFIFSLSSIKGSVGSSLAIAFTIFPLILAIIPSSIIVFFKQRRILKYYQNNPSQPLDIKKLLTDEFPNYIFIFFCWLIIPPFLMGMAAPSGGEFIKIVLIVLTLTMMPAIMISLCWIILLIIELKCIARITKSPFLYLPYLQFMVLLGLLVFLIIRITD